MYALLLLALPSVLTRQKLLELLELTERQKTFAVEPPEGAALPSGTFSKTHPNYSFSFPVTLQDVPQQGFLLVDQFAQALAMLSSLAVASPAGMVFPLLSVKHPCGFCDIIR